MITTELENGQGLGNQLWCYAVTRAIALDRGYDFGIESPEKFKGADFMNLDFGKKPAGITHEYAEKGLIHPLNGSDIRAHDPGLSEVADNTKITGYMQDENYIARHKEDIRRWFAIKPDSDCRDFSADDICVLNFRGSGYMHHPELFLPKRYWTNAMRNMRRINPDFKFIVITEDVATARKFFPNLPIHHFSIGTDYSIIKNARYLILSNTSFAFFPAWLSTDLRYCIAPKYWARHNVSDGYWSQESNLTRGWMYQDRKGNLQDHDSCAAELASYKKRNPDIFMGTSAKPAFSARMKDSWRTFKALSADSSVFKTLARMMLIASTQTALKAKSGLNPQSSAAAPQEDYQWTAPAQPKPKPSIKNRVKDSIMIQGYY